MTHKSTEQPESEDERALRLVLWLDQLSNCKFGPAAEAARLIETLHARVQELEAQTAHMADLVELADYATKKLEASQAQRVPMNPYQVRDIVQKLNAEHGDNWNHADLVREAEAHHGITQEKQG